MRDWKRLTLPNGQTIDTTGLKRTELWRESGIEKDTDLQSLPKEEADKVMEVCRQLFSDQVASV